MRSFLLKDDVDVKGDRASLQVRHNGLRAAYVALAAIKNATFYTADEEVVMKVSL